MSAITHTRIKKIKYGSVNKLTPEIIKIWLYVFYYIRKGQIRELCHLILLNSTHTHTVGSQV